mmetsp:Transcript_7436/g.16078  ORF Transcript_7436/g.16078 Transcript_7436/m.16078 type:complete len:250 (+) Transcript_7436:1834-2583(+)
MSRAALRDALRTPSFPSPNPNAIRNPSKILSNGRSRVTFADGSLSEDIARNTPSRTATLPSLSSSAGTFFFSVEDDGALNWLINKSLSNVRSFLGAPKDLASNFFVAFVFFMVGAPVIFAILPVTCEVFFVFVFFGNPVSNGTFFLTGFFLVAAAGRGWTGKGDDAAAGDDFGCSSSSGAGKDEMKVLHSLTIFFFADSPGCIPNADAIDAEAARAMVSSSWLNNGSSGTAYIFDGGSRGVSPSASSAS